MGCFLLQKNILLMRLILLGYYAAFFPVKYHPNIAPEHHTNSRRHHPGQWCHYGENGAGHRLFLPLRTRALPASHATEWRLKSYT